jgi:hypothetical protein
MLEIILEQRGEKRNLYNADTTMRIEMFAIFRMVDSFSVR